MRVEDYTQFIQIICCGFETTIAYNDERKVEMAKRVLSAVNGNPEAKIAVLGLAFKGGTDDCRESPAMDILRELIKCSHNVSVYDPKAMDNAHRLIGDSVNYAADAYEAAKNADILVILTEWEEFRHLDLPKLKEIMNKPKIVDLRNMLGADEVCKNGFEHHVAMVRTNVKDILEEAIGNYLGWELYSHE